MTFCKFYITFILLYTISLAYAQSYEEDSLAVFLCNEVKYYYKNLKEKDLPAHYISMAIVDEKRVTLRSSFGLFSVEKDTQARCFSPQIRIGNPLMDNYQRKSQSFSYSGERRILELPIDSSPTAGLKEQIWLFMHNYYKQGCEAYNRVRTDRDMHPQEQDTIPSFSQAQKSLYYEAPLSESDTVIDRLKYCSYLNGATTVLKEMKKLTRGEAVMEFVVQRKYFVNSEGSLVVQNVKTYRITLITEAMAEDGTLCPISQDIFAYSEDELPSQKSLSQAIQQLAARSIALSEAPLADAYTGPALLSGEASGVFFHEVLGHRLEGSRRPSARDELRPFLNKRILPEDMQLYFDPTLKYLCGHALNGFYVFDDEGVRGQRVDCIQDGILRGYLLGRSPMKGFCGSNGHGRADFGLDAMPRQSNMVVETRKPYTQIELREMLIRELIRQRKEYGYFFKSVSDGYTITGNDILVNSFNVNPIEVYRVYTDGRPDQLVRGVSLIGTPLTMFSNIQAAGGEKEVFTGVCGSTSGDIPVSAIAPMVFVSQIETQGRGSNNTQYKDVVGVPESDMGDTFQNMNSGEIIFKALEDEMEHIKSELKKNALVQPIFIDLIVGRKSEFTAKSSLGSAYGSDFSNESPENCVSAKIVLLDGRCMATSFLDKNLPLPDELEYNCIRRTLAKACSEAYRMALLQFLREHNTKRDDKGNEKTDSLWTRFPVKEYAGNSALTNRSSCIEVQNAANQLSSILFKFPDLFGSVVRVTQRRRDFYRLTSEKQKILHADSVLFVEVDVLGKSDSEHGDAMFYRNTLPSLTNLNLRLVTDEVEATMTDMVRKNGAQKIGGTFFGPVMLTDDALFTFLKNRILRVPSETCEYTFDSIGGERKFPSVCDDKLSLYLLGNDSVYNGIKLIGYTRTDADGIEPATLPVIENGHLIHTQGRGRGDYRKSTGNEGFSFRPLSTSFGFGVMHLVSSKTMSYEKMLKQMRKMGKKSKSDYGLIVKSFNNILKVDLKTGEQKPVLNEFHNRLDGWQMNIYSVCKEEVVHNKVEYQDIPCSFILPKAVMLNDVTLKLNSKRGMDLYKEIFDLRH